MPPLGFDAYKVLLPSIFGLALSSTVVNICIQVAHATTGTSTFSGFTMFISAVIISLLFISTLVVKRFDKRFISSTTYGAAVLAVRARWHRGARCAWYGALALDGSAAGRWNHRGQHLP